MLTGQMQSHPLLISSLIEHAKRHGDSKWSRLPEGERADLPKFIGELYGGQPVTSVRHFSIGSGGNACRNSSRHFELYFCCIGYGSSSNTINPRLLKIRLPISSTMP
jgi:fatty-acyl-CoA synthase